LNYRRVSCPTNTETLDFISDIGMRFPDEMKVIQLNFEALEKQKAKGRYENPAAQVFILESFETLTESDLLQRLPDEAVEPMSWDFFESAETFKQNVAATVNEISKGRLYQVNLTTGLSTKTKNSAAGLFKSYFNRYNGRHKALLPLENVDAICFSPEMFLEKKKSGLKTCPIKGSISEDQNFEKDLLHNRKEEAELSMIVDLLRNDLNRIENKNSAVVTAHRKPMRLGYIQHTYSEIQIETEQTLPQILAATYPGGSISGCPKIESLKLINELEEGPRQIYTGSIGWWQKNEFCLNLAIRTFIKSRDDLYYHAGCGIVYDSNPEDEWKEFITKTAKLQEAAL
ncbi:MAG: chorismate-binding protein, partial [Bdellovibrionaceae bacterium]|nr:chorismate-binding protein [Pseudobdellovibrionaceae bacterium]